MKDITLMESSFAKKKQKTKQSKNQIKKQKNQTNTDIPKLTVLNYNQY